MAMTTSNSMSVNARMALETGGTHTGKVSRHYAAKIGLHNDFVYGV
jgi:hypothetical protein